MPPIDLGFWQNVLLYAPLGIIGAWRWSVWLFQKVSGLRYRPLSPSDPLAADYLATRPALSVVTPVYNEDPDHFEASLASWKRNDVDEIVAVIDESDTPCIAVFEKFQAWHPSKVTKLIITDEPGKRPALVKGARAATGDIIALVDSDTLWDDNIRDILLAPFSDPTVGGVGCRQEVIAPETPAEKLFAIRLTLRYLHEYPYLASIGDALTCLSGRTAVYRRTAILPELDDLKNETFLWKPCISGDDKRLTSLVMKKGWKLRYQGNASVRTYPMATLKQFFKQNLRWARNSWRTDLRMMGSSWTWKREPLFLYHLLDRSIQPFTLLLGPIFFVVALYFHHYIAAGILFAWWLISRTIKLLPHLREVPSDIRMVPLFTFAQFHLAVLKIYAFLTLDFQSWITRWDKNRMQRESLTLLPSRIATAGLIGTIAFFVFQHQATAVEALAIKKEKASFAYTSNVDFERMNLDAQEAHFWNERARHAEAKYVTRLKDTPAHLVRRFNLPENAYSTLFAGRLRNIPFPVGTELAIPIDYLRTPLSLERLALQETTRPIITYNGLTNTIDIRERGSVVDIVEIRDALALLPGQQAGEALLVETAPKEWLLRANLHIHQDSTVVFHNGQVETLRLASGEKGFSIVRTERGSLLIQGVHVTSWDESIKGPDRNIEDGRAILVAYTGGRMDILDSEISYLGYPLDVARRLGTSFGGTYGLSWKIPNGSFNQNLLTGSLIRSRVHHNHFGLYAFGATGLVIRDNEVYQNTEYGIDPHDDANNLLIEGNFVHSNGNHGIIGSKRVMYSTIRNNRSVGNRLHGIMLDRQSNYNLVENNRSSGQVNGMALYDSHHNLVRQNSFIGNRLGIRANMASAENRFTENEIRSNEKGIYLYGQATKNVFLDNVVAYNSEGVKLKDAHQNVIRTSLKPDDNNTQPLKFDESSRTTNYVESIP